MLDPSISAGFMEIVMIYGSLLPFVWVVQNAVICLARTEGLSEGNSPCRHFTKYISFVVNAAFDTGPLLFVSILDLVSESIGGIVLIR